MFGRALKLAGLTGIFLCGGFSAALSDATRGRDLSRLHCARCHVIPDLRNMGIGSTPSFKIMVKSRAGDWRDKFEAFYSLPPHPAFVTVKELRTGRVGPAIAAPVIISLHDIDDLMDYVDVLARKFRGKAE